MLNNDVRPIALPKKGQTIRAHLSCAVAGWGVIGNNKPASKVLREATEKTQFSFECKNIWQQYFNGTYMLCTKFDKNKEGICQVSSALSRRHGNAASKRLSSPLQGDSGGPLLCNGKLQGLTAYTLQDNCIDAKFPHVFMKVSYFVPWIESVMQRF